MHGACLVHQHRMRSVVVFCNVSCCLAEIQLLLSRLQRNFCRPIAAMHKL